MSPEDRAEADRKLARDVLRGTAVAPDKLLALAKRLRNEQDFTLARRVLARAAGKQSLKRPENRGLLLEIEQQSALCTYKDSDLPADERLDQALAILEGADDLAITTNQETLGIAGAIHKRKWELYAKRQELERSLHYYLRGYKRGVEGDQGYTAINAAFVLDLLADQEDEEEKRSAGGSSPAAERRAEAAAIREDIIARVPPFAAQAAGEWLRGKWWFYATVAEAHFGLRQYPAAAAWLERGRAAVSRVPEWELQSTLLQLARLALLHEKERSAAELEKHEAWRTLEQVFRDHKVAVRGAFLGKVGLALSGGGFRAALYHIGVLAKLAELDLLRHVEVLSCVSGGSIVGAHYYLEVRKLLASKPDAEVTREDYLEIVGRLEKHFVAGVQRNLRTRVVADLLTTLKMIFRPDYSRTLRLGELYENEIFSRVDDGAGGKPRWLNELRIVPRDEAPGFAPKSSNWRRAAKAPILVLNATSLNTGHNWQFTASWMGEPPAAIAAAIDGNEQLRRMYYWEAPAKHQQVRLGHAVAASSCVPGLFEPLVLDGLYPDRVVRLVDGGVCDNQGIAGLLEQGCNVLLVSDGSGQSASQPNPSVGLLGVPMRANTVLQARVRDAQYHDVRARLRSSLLRGLMFVHLKADLDVDPVDWVDCQDPYEASDDARPPERRGPLTRYGIAKDVQTLLAGIRTDLDSFNDLEAAALMTSGYEMTATELDSSPNLTELASADDQRPPGDWAFLAAKQGMVTRNDKMTHLKRVLGVSGTLAFKVWKLSTPLKVVAAILAAALLVWAAWVVVRPPPWLVSMAHAPVGGVVGWLLTLLLTMVASAVGVYLFGKTVVRLVRWRDTLWRVIAGVSLGLLATVAARIHLHVFDRLFLSKGSMERFARVP
ncbi:MAG TPA: tetratricopeptide repeat-containing protein [Thermoanaerobaculia bacterium]|nr:tetratricopeptide repeat-containing protein [Thermoanaerobaculia bacterium]